MQQRDADEQSHRDDDPEDADEDRPLDPHRHPDDRQPPGGPVALDERREREDEACRECRDERQYDEAEDRRDRRRSDAAPHRAVDRLLPQRSQPSSESGAFPTARAQRRKAVAVEPLDALVLEPCGRPQRIHERHEEEESDPDDEHEAQTETEERHEHREDHRTDEAHRGELRDRAEVGREARAAGRHRCGCGGCGADHGSTVGAGRAGHSGGIPCPRFGITPGSV